MKICKPVSRATEDGRTSGNYAAIWEATASLTDGQWLPIKCDNKIEIRRLYNAARQNGKFKASMNTKELTVYLRMKQ